MRLTILLLLVISMNTSAYASSTKRCLYINSYHVGYAWSDKIESAVKTVLSGHCELTVFRMDSKRNTSPVFIQQKALEAKALIETFKPDVVIASDDNASKYLIAPYYKDADMPFVFCGINWTAKPYAYPYANATGMIEVSAIKTLLIKSRDIIGGVKTVAFIGAKGIRTDEKEFEWMAKVYAREGVVVRALYAADMVEWEQAYLTAQDSDLIVLNNYAGIKKWDKQRAVKFATQHAGKLTVSTYDFMTPYTMLAMTKVAEEQGEWAAKVAIRILQGKSVASIPVVANRRFNVFVNFPILNQTDIHLPEAILFKAIKVK
ncbi:MAG: ABC transporter substrate binding protein, partial [Mariprofundaceae bacterium]|nr:ABC transporter substrate binding protein [Mariprofundaceae bacterium]